MGLCATADDLYIARAVYHDNRSIAAVLLVSQECLHREKKCFYALKARPLSCPTHGEGVHDKREYPQTTTATPNSVISNDLTRLNHDRPK